MVKSGNPYKRYEFERFLGLPFFTTDNQIILKQAIDCCSQGVVIAPNRHRRSDQSPPRPRVSCAGWKRVDPHGRDGGSMHLHALTDGHTWPAPMYSRQSPFVSSCFGVSPEYGGSRHQSQIPRIASPTKSCLTHLLSVCGARLILAWLGLAWLG